MHGPGWNADAANVDLHGKKVLSQLRIVRKTTTCKLPTRLISLSSGVGYLVAFHFRLQFVDVPTVTEVGEGMARFMCSTDSIFAKLRLPHSSFRLAETCAWPCSAQRTKIRDTRFKSDTLSCLQCLIAWRMRKFASHFLRSFKETANGVRLWQYGMNLFMLLSSRCSFPP
eukprot:6190627-Pleurochrysis_carterae.AAC.8